VRTRAYYTENKFQKQQSLPSIPGEETRKQTFIKTNSSRVSVIKSVRAGTGTGIIDACHP
jgi:ribosomal protein L7/L12